MHFQARYHTLKGSCAGIAALSFMKTASCLRGQVAHNQANASYEGCRLLPAPNASSSEWTPKSCTLQADILE